MSVIAGIWYRDGNPGTMESDLGELQRILGQDNLWTWTSDGFAVVGLESGLGPDRPYHVDAEGTASVLTGRLLLSGGPPASDREDLARLHGEWRRQNWKAAGEARGVFAAIHFDPGAKRLAIVSDDLAVRPLYHWSDTKRVVFASCLWVLEEFSGVPKVMDVVAVGQLAAYGYALGERTPYHGVRRNQAGQTLVYSRDGQQVFTREPPICEVDPEDASAAVGEAFAGAVRDRLGTATRAVAFLSGGMDSRAIVASLLERDAEVFTYNFGWERSQDHAFATAFARAAGTRHTHRPWVVGARARASATMAAALAEAEASGEHGWPRAVWSGDGGSVGLGWVYLTREVVGHLREGRERAALASYLGDHGTDPRRILAGDLRRSEAMDPVTNLVEEYRANATDDPVRTMHRFLLRNDQRRHLHDHFETILSHRVELHLPFFDPRLRGVVEGTPPDRFLYHRLYAQWWEKLPEVVRSVPWQTYPGHVPCPVPSSGEYEYQWETEYVPPHRKQERAKRRQEIADVLFSRDFPGEILSRPRVLAAYAATRSGWRDYTWLLSVAALFGRYWLKSGGRYVGP